MGMDWDPEGDAERSKENRGRWYLTIAIVLGLLGYLGKQIYHWHQEKQRDEILRELSERNGY
jgi:hypothetical protein